LQTFIIDVKIADSSVETNGLCQARWKMLTAQTTFLAACTPSTPHLTVSSPVKCASVMYQAWLITLIMLHM